MSSKIRKTNIFIWICQRKILQGDLVSSYLAYLTSLAKVDCMIGTPAPYRGIVHYFFNYFILEKCINR